MSPKKIKIAIDMDEVLAKFNKKLMHEFSQRYKDDLLNLQLKANNASHLMIELNEKVEEIIFEPTFFQYLEVMENSQSVVRELNHRFDVYIATAAMYVPTCFGAKYEWLITHFPFLDPMKFVFCGDKSIIHADYLIDDHVNQLEVFQGTGLLFTSSHNMKEVGYKRFNNWLEISDFFKNLE
jgi:5'(3')-deoxyribonucleotidase